MFTLTLVFNKETSKVLMCYHNKQNIHNFIGGKVNDCECPIAASYRELEEETGITKDDIKLEFLQQENCATWQGNCWSMYIMVGVLNKDVDLKEEENGLYWVEVHDEEFLQASGFEGDCWVYMNRAKIMLKEKGLWRI